MENKGGVAIVNLVLSTSCCENPEMDWVKGITPKKGRPKVLLLQGGLDNEYFPGYWHLPYCDPPLLEKEDDEFEDLDHSAINSISHHLSGISVVVNKPAIEKTMITLKVGPIRRYIKCSWEANALGIQLRSYGSNLDSVTGYGWFNRDEVKTLKMKRNDKSCLLGLP